MRFDVLPGTFTSQAHTHHPTIFGAKNSASSERSTEVGGIKDLLPGVMVQFQLYEARADVRMFDCYIISIVYAYTHTYIYIHIYIYIYLSLSLSVCHACVF